MPESLGQDPRVVAVAASPEHGFSKELRPLIRLVQGHGVEGDAHAGAKVRHRSRLGQDPLPDNLRQVHLIHAELLDELNAQGFSVEAGQLGENLLTREVELLALPRGARLHLGESAIVELTGLRNPCAQIEGFRPGLLAAVLGRDEEGKLVRKSGVMAVVLAGGLVRPGDDVRIELPPLPHHALERV